ncbi:hypothetical protein JCM30760_21170 [Thiomicrorhabdus hydrogeniphila]
MSIAKLITKQIPGSHKTKSYHIKRGEKIAQMIHERFLISSPYQWQVKHLKWTLQMLSRDIGNNTLYDYWLTIRKIASCLGKWSHWKEHLPPPKHLSSASKGGRKPLLSNKKPISTLQ